MIGWATLKKGKVAHAWFMNFSKPSRVTACGIWKSRDQVADDESAAVRRCRACLRLLKRDYKRKRGGAIY